LVLDVKMPGINGFGVVEQVFADPALRSTPMLLLTSGAEMDEMVRCRQLGVASCLTKPVSRERLYEAVQNTLLHPRSNQDQAAAAETGQAGFLAAGLAREGEKPHVLLAEDSPVNQKLVTTVLQKNGYKVTLVENGFLAVQAAQAERFDCVLMDIQMPDMDGHEATRLIRRHEAATGQAHVPVIALTANAISGDAEKCLEAGMDFYLSKPVNSKRLLEVVEKFVRQQVPAGSEVPQPAEDDATGLIDMPNLMAQTEGDIDLAADLARMFLVEFDGRLEAVVAAAEARDGTALKDAAHALKGMIGVFSKGQAFMAVRDLDAAAKRDDFSCTVPLCQQLQAGAVALRQDLESMLRQWEVPLGN